MAQEKLAATLNKESRALIMLEYSDNVEQVSEIRKKVCGLYPQAEIILQPISLTSGRALWPGDMGRGLSAVGVGYRLRAIGSRFNGSRAMSYELRNYE